MERDEILRKPRPLIADRIDLRHRIMDALIDSGMKLQHGHLAESIDKIDEIVWVDGDMRTTRLRYDLFTTFRRKGMIDFDEAILPGDEKGRGRLLAKELFEILSDMLLARGTGVELDELGPENEELIGHRSLVQALELQAGVTERLTALLENLAGQPRIAGVSPPVMKPGVLTNEHSDANQKTEQPSKPGTPGGKGKPKS